MLIVRDNTYEISIKGIVDKIYETEVVLFGILQVTYSYSWFDASDIFFHFGSIFFFISDEGLDKFVIL